jgi:predicted esterase
MQSHKIKVQKTARYFVLGEPGPHIKQVWFICHGYGQLGNYFLRNFDAVNDGSCLFVSCEGLHRFYVNGFSGRVGASWMTKEDRADDIDDYIHYLDDVYKEVMATIDQPVKITAFGFSQGTATVCRWIGSNLFQIDRLVLWAGAFPSDVDLQLNAARFNAFQTSLVLGDADEFIKETDIASLTDHFDKAGIAYTLLRFTGKHELNTETLRLLLKGG